MESINPMMMKTTAHIYRQNSFYRILGAVLPQKEVAVLQRFRQNASMEAEIDEVAV